MPICECGSRRCGLYLHHFAKRGCVLHDENTVTAVGCFLNKLKLSQVTYIVYLLPIWPINHHYADKYQFMTIPVNVMTSICIFNKIECKN